MSPRTCSNSCPRVSTRSVVSAQYMNASSGSGLWPTRICKRRTLAPLSRLAVEEPALQQRKNLFPREGARVRLAAVRLEHVDVVLERLVRPNERVVELVALENEVLRARLVRLAVLRIHCAPDRPDRAGPALDPDDDLLVRTDVVDA